jgi:hypothetical protein
MKDRVSAVSDRREEKEWIRTSHSRETSDRCFATAT